MANYEAACKSTSKKIVNMEKLRSSTNIKQGAVDSLIEELSQVCFHFNPG